MELSASDAADKHSGRAAWALVAVTLVWGTTFIVNAEVLGREPPLAYVAARFVLAALILNAAALGRPATAGIWRESLGMGVLLAAGMGAQIVGQTETSASKTAFITGLSVVLTPVRNVRTRRFQGGRARGVALRPQACAALVSPQEAEASTAAT
jgi:drug/metabolite transporter (DMT)-like permease